MLARGELHMIGATTIAEYRKHIEADAALERRFQPILVAEPTVDETIFFHSLNQSDLEQFLKIQLRQLKERLDPRGLQLALTPEARSLLLDQGFDRYFGARPLKRAIQRLVVDPLALQLLEGQFADGDEIVGEVLGKTIQLHTRTLTPA